MDMGVYWAQLSLRSQISAKSTVTTYQWERPPLSTIVGGRCQRFRDLHLQRRLKDTSFSFAICDRKTWALATPVPLHPNLLLEICLDDFSRNKNIPVNHDELLRPSQEFVQTVYVRASSLFSYRLKGCVTVDGGKPREDRGGAEFVVDGVLEAEARNRCVQAAR